jgi:membrane-bound lytic murein transglycosylase B
VGILAVVLGLYGLPELAALRSGPNLSSPSGTSLPTGFPPPPVPSPPATGGYPGAPDTRTPGAIFPSAAASQPPGAVAGRPADTLGAWATHLKALGIPKVALQAYGYAELVVGRSQPNCKLSWTMLAGIGSVESNHGRHAGAKLLDSGVSDPKILGIPLDGTTTERIADTDGGTIDGNPAYDQAVGPMQFIPATWKQWAADADGDGRSDPFDIDDAALTAGFYLCANNRNLSTADGWWSAVLSYNRVTRYAMDVYNATDRYGRESLQG